MPPIVCLTLPYARFPLRRGLEGIARAGYEYVGVGWPHEGAEVIGFDLLMQEESMHHAREDGRLRLVGKDYEVQDGDVIHFRFNV